MPKYAINSALQPMFATGIVSPISTWVEHEGGRRVPTDEQAHDDATGQPLWAVEVTYRVESWGRVSTATAQVTVGALTMPTLGTFTPVTFVNLTLQTHLNKNTHKLVETWRADGIETSGGVVAHKADAKTPAAS